MKNYKKNFKNFYSPFLLILFLFQYINSKVILWDLGSTLIETNKLKAVKEIGLMDILKYNNKFGFKDRIFAVLETLGRQENTPLAYNEDKVLPDIMCKWLSGEVNGPDVVERSLKQIKTLNKQGFFEDDREKRLIENAIKFMFDPEKLANTARIIKRSLKIYKDCVKRKDGNGQPMHRIIIFSNWDRLSFEVFKKMPIAEKIFKHIPKEDIVISAHIGMIKPHRCAYEYVLQKYNLNPKDCILIDDQSENTEMARNLGMKAYSHGKDWKKLKDILEFEGIL